MLRQSHRRLAAALVLLVGSILGCRHGGREVELSVVPPGLGAREIESFQQFRQTIVPILESRCALKCHGVSPENFARFQHSADHAGSFFFPVDFNSGRIPNDTESLIEVFRVTRGATHDDDGHAQGHSRIEYGEAAVFSQLLRAPLAVALGGSPHRGLDVFSREDDPDYLALRQWVDTELALRPVEKKPLTKEEAFFGDEILPLLVRNGCFLSSCHGPTVFNDLKYELPLPSRDGKLDVGRDFSRKAMLANRKKMLGAKSRFANLGGDVRLSRLLVKNLPLSKGGVHQRGGNIQFFDSYDDPDVQTILKWLEIEKDALTAKLRSRDKPIPAGDLGRLQGVAFIRGPRHQPRRFFDLEQFWPGSDIFLVPLAEGQSLESATAKPVNLTAQFHKQGPVEIQGFDVRYDGKAIVFSMRSDREQGFRLYEIQLDDDLNYVDGSFSQVSFHEEKSKDGAPVHCLDPIYTPGPNDSAGTILDDVAIAYASNVAGDYTASDTYALLGEADGGDARTIIDAQRTESPGTFDRRRLYIVDGPNKGEWRTIERHSQDERSVVGARLKLDRPLPHPVDRQTVYTIEKLRADNLPAFDIWRCVPNKQSDARGSFISTVRRMTFTSAQERRPSMRTTGEVMFTSVRNIGFQADRPVFNGAIFRVMAGGFDYHIQGGNRSRYPLFIDSRELPEGLEIRQSLDPRNLWGGGVLMLVDHGFGVHIEPDNPVDNIALSRDDEVLGKPLRSSSRRYLPAMLPFFPETGRQAVTATGQTPGGSVRDAFPLADGTILLSRAARGFDHLDAKAEPDWDLSLLRFEKSLQSEDAHAVGRFQLTKIAAASTTESAEYYPRPVVVRLKETTRTHHKFAPRSDGIKPQRVDGVLRMPEGLLGTVECYDYPLLQSFLTHFAPVGPRNFRIGREGPVPGEADPDNNLRYVRILAQDPATKSDATPIEESGDPFATAVSQGIHTRKRIVAEVPLEADGSFHVNVPTEVPLIVQGLNHHKMALHSMNRWFYLQPGEKLTFSIPRKIFPTLCSGCHGALTGDSRHVLGPPDVVSSASRVMATWDAAAKVRRPPNNAGQTEGDYVSIDFRRDVQPILDRRCTSCHDGAGPQAAELDLRGTPTKHYTVAYETLHMLRAAESGNHADKRFVNEREGMAIESYLIEKLLGRELQSLQKLNTAGTPHPATGGVTEQEMLTLIRWIDLGATFLGGRQQPPRRASSPTRTQELR